MLVDDGKECELKPTIIKWKIQSTGWCEACTCEVTLTSSDLSTAAMLIFWRLTALCKSRRILAVPHRSTVCVSWIRAIGALLGNRSEIVRLFL